MSASLTSSNAIPQGFEVIGGVLYNTKAYEPIPDYITSIFEPPNETQNPVQDSELESDTPISGENQLPQTQLKESDETEEKGEKFGFLEGAFHVLKGVVTKGVGSILKTAAEHPLMTGLGIVAGAAACFFFPIAAPIALGVMAAGVGIKATVDGINSAQNASELYDAGEYDAAKEELENVGGDAFIATTSFIAAGKAIQSGAKAYKAGKTTGPEPGSQKTTGPEPGSQKAIGSESGSQKTTGPEPGSQKATGPEPGSQKV